MPITYEITPCPEGWIVTCNGVAGAPFLTLSDAVQDTLFVAKKLGDRGETVVVRLLEFESTPRVWRTLEPRDARLFRNP